ncbi:MAG TPA: 5'/3'-nucleotidase SurE [Cytophagales bacterium]|nr:5'/3'-nucleotidase SurE [Cytophagales bacterium]
MYKKPLILVCNDDGITSRGIKLVVEIAKTLGEVVVVAPDSPQSAMGHAITIANTLRLRKSDIFEGVLAYECSGTPADCVKLAKHHVLHGRKPDLVLSGMNHGSNSSISVLYSGTMSAAIEAAIEGLPAIGFSLCDYDHETDLDHCATLIKQIISEGLQKNFPKGVALNVNFPAKKEEPIKGVKICRQAAARWEEKFDERQDPLGRNYFWMSGFFINEDKGEDTDEWALAHNYASIVPCQFDLTAHHAIAQLNKEWNFES